MASVPLEMSPERREQRRRRRRRKRLARAKNQQHANPPPACWMDHQHNNVMLPSEQNIDLPHKLSISLDEQTPTTQEPTLIDTTFEDDNHHDESARINSKLLQSNNDDGTCQESSALGTPTPRLPDESTIDGSLFSDRYSLTVSHHQKITAIPLSPNADSKQQRQHRMAVEQLRKTRRQHRRGMDSSRSSMSGGSYSDFGSIGEFTFLGELQAVASDVSFFFTSIKESLTDPHVAACCTRPTYISYRKRKPRPRR